MASVKPSWGAPATTSPPASPPTSAPQAPKPSRLPSAAEEKEMLRRYHNATRAVQRHQEANFGPSDGIVSSGSSSLPQSSTVGPYASRDIDDPSNPAPDELPPPWVPSPEFSQTDEMSEKERYRIASEARERAAAAAGQQSALSPHTATSPPSDYYTATGTHAGVNGSGLRESTADGGLPPPWHPTSPVVQSGLPPHLRSRSPPVPPPNPAQPGAPRMLSAAEEKAQLKAKYDTEQQSTSSQPVSPLGQQEYHSSPGATPSPGKPSPTPIELTLSRDQRQAAVPTSAPPLTPPPLLPRPPASYIQETAEEDARLQDELANGQLSAVPNGTTTTTAKVSPSVSPTEAGTFTLGDDDAFGLLRPSSPFTVGWDPISARTAGAGADPGMNGLGSSSPSSPPPLPPKVPLGY
jgi:hypothetical protein